MIYLVCVAKIQTYLPVYNFSLGVLVSLPAKSAMLELKMRIQAGGAGLHPTHIFTIRDWVRCWNLFKPKSVGHVAPF